MSKFYIEPGAVTNTSKRVCDAGEEFIYNASRLRRANLDLSMIMTRYPALEEAIEGCALFADKLGRKAQDYGVAAWTIAKTYEFTDQRIAGQIKPNWTGNYGPGGSTTYDPTCPAQDKPGDTTLDRIRDVLRMCTTLNPEVLGLLGLGRLGHQIGEYLGDVEDEHTNKQTGDKLEFKGPGPTNENKNETRHGKTYNPETHKWEDNTDTSLKDKMADDPRVRIAGVNGEFSLAHGEKEFGSEDDLAYAELHADALKFEGHAEAFASPKGVGVGVGASAVALAFGASGKVGNDMFDVHGSADVSAGKLAAEAELGVGYDQNGNLRVGGSASLEAIAAEASATGGVKIAGTDVDVTGSVNIGVGAHAEFGYNDGKLSCDLGASLGVGVSVKIEVDISGTIDAVCDWADSALSWLGW